MIHKYRFRNFFSFAEETEVSFVLNRQVPDSDLVFESPRAARLSKLLAVIGPNASGKTNVLKPLAFLNWFVAHSFTAAKPQDEVPLIPHFFSGDENSEFEIDFEVEGQLYRYSLIANPAGVVHESLRRKTSKLFRFIFRRDWSVEDSAYDIRQQNFGFAIREAEKVRQNASLIATAAQYNVPLALELASFFNRFYSNISHVGRLHFETGNVFESAEFFHGRPALRTQMSEILIDMDLGLDDIIIESLSHVDQESGKSEEIKLPIGIHRKGKQKEKLPLILESSGTQAAFVLMRRILPALEHGGIVIVDEIEADLHPAIVSAMLELFIDPERNPNHAQILFSCHVHEVLDVLQKEQILLVEKDPDGFSEAWRLGDMKGVRRDDNLYSKYRAGAYGAIPDLAV